MKPAMPPQPDKVKAVIFDVYHTLLLVEKGWADAAQRWVGWWQGFMEGALAPPLEEFDRQCRDLVEQDHVLRRAEGCGYPEVDWRSVACRAAPELSGLSQERLDRFLSGHAGLQRRTRAMPGARAFLAGLRAQGILTGLASNAQRYTWDELAAAGIVRENFSADCSFWSFEQGFSKPDPKVYAMLKERLAHQGIRPEETLMIGDRLDNDILPARAAGWQAWHFQGRWPEL